MEEEHYLAAGETTPTFDLPWGRCALAICYDLRFPELFRKYALAGASIIFVPAEWPQARLEHWRTLLRARAIENQLFVVACNRVGESKGTEFCGHSAIYDPWGEPVVEGDRNEVLLTADIDLRLVEEVRRRIPVFADRRVELY
jgi:predicted amidohydrolase